MHTEMQDFLRLGYLLIKVSGRKEARKYSFAPWQGLCHLQPPSKKSKAIPRSWDLCSILYTLSFNDDICSFRRWRSISNDHHSKPCQAARGDCAFRSAHPGAAAGSAAISVRRRRWHQTPSSHPCRLRPAPAASAALWFDPSEFRPPVPPKYRWPRGAGEQLEHGGGCSLRCLQAERRKIVSGVLGTHFAASPKTCSSESWRARFKGCVTSTYNIEGGFGKRLEFGELHAMTA